MIKLKKGLKITMNDRTFTKLNESERITEQCLMSDQKSTR
jgi:hypothetical protein